MSYSLRTLLIAMLLGGPLCAWGWRQYQAYRERQRWIEMTFPFQNRDVLIKSMLCPSHPPDSDSSAGAVP